MAHLTSFYSQETIFWGIIQMRDFSKHWYKMVIWIKGQYSLYSVNSKYLINLFWCVVLIECICTTMYDPVLRDGWWRHRSEEEGGSWDPCCWWDVMGIGRQELVMKCNNSSNSRQPDIAQWTPTNSNGVTIVTTTSPRMNLQLQLILITSMLMMKTRTEQYRMRTMSAGAGCGLACYRSATFL